MIPGLGTFVDRLGATAGKNYLIAGFYPVFIATTACAFAALLVFPDTQEWWETIGEQEEGTLDGMKLVVALLLIVTLVGFVVWSLNTWLRELLQAPPLLKFMLRRMEQYQHARRSVLKDELETAMYDLARYRKFAGLDVPDAISVGWARDTYKRELWINQLQIAEGGGRKFQKRLMLIGCEKNKARLQIRMNSSFRKLKRQARALGRAMFWRSPIRFDDVHAYFKALHNHLSWVAVDLHSEADIEKLASLKLKFPKLAQYARVKTQTVVDAKLSERIFRYPNEDSTLAPTSIGNMAELHRVYALKRFGMQVDLFWPRMRKHVAADEKFTAVFEEVKTRLDFAVAMTWLSLVFTLVWAVIASVWAKDYLTAFLWVVTPAYLATMLFYVTATAAFRAFSEALVSAIDLFRFDLLKSLHVELPDDPKSEHALWTQLSDELVTLQPGDQKYKHS